MARWTLPSFLIVAALLCTAAVSQGLVYGSQIVLLLLLGLMAFTLIKGFASGAPN